MTLPDIVLDQAALDSLFPWYLAVDPDLRLTCGGRVITRLLPAIADRPFLTDLFHIDRPHGITDFTRLVEAGGQTFLLAAIDRPTIRLKGQVMTPPGFPGALLLAGPWINDSNVLEELGLSVSDFALGDATPDLMFLVDTQAALLADAKALAHRLQHARDEALAMSRTKTEFLANMSHELRTPLNAILGFSEYLMLFGGRVKAEQIADYARDIHNSGRFLLDIINDLLDLSRIEAGKLTLDETDFDLAELIRETARSVGTEAVRSSVRIDLIGVDDPLILRADRRLVRQMLLNLLSNAIKFNRPQGSVTVTLAPDGAAGLAIEVADTGIGIDPAKIPELFQPFRQADSQIARRYGGTGLGLAIVRQLARLHEGEVDMESAPGIGTRVRLHMPAARVRAASGGHATACRSVAAE